MKTIVTVQHTQSVHHTNGMVGSWTDWDLTALGQEQARRIGQRLRAEFPARDFTLYASDLLRARRTAELVGEPFGLAPILRRELRERNLGRCCGQSVQWLRENKEREERRVDDRLFSDAESRRDEWLRLRPFFDSLMASGEENVLLVSHGDLLGVFHAMFLGLEPEALERVELSGAPGAVSLLLVDGQGRRILRRFGDLSYLREEA